MGILVATLHGQCSDAVVGVATPTFSVISPYLFKFIRPRIHVMSSPICDWAVKEMSMSC